MRWPNNLLTLEPDTTVLTPHSQHHSVPPGLVATSPNFTSAAPTVWNSTPYLLCSVGYFVYACWSACKAIVLHVYHQLGVHVSISLVRGFYQENPIVQVFGVALNKNELFWTKRNTEHALGFKQFASLNGTKKLFRNCLISFGSCNIHNWSALAWLQLKLNSTRFELG